MRILCNPDYTKRYIILYMERMILLKI